MIKLSIRILLPLFVLMVFGMACQKSEEEKAKGELVNYLNKQFQTPWNTCRVRFEPDYPKKGILFGEICSDSLEKGVGWIEILTPDNIKRMKAVGFKTIELKRWDLSADYDLDKAWEVYGSEKQTESKEPTKKNLPRTKTDTNN